MNLLPPTALDPTFVTEQGFKIRHILTKRSGSTEDQKIVLNLSSPLLIIGFLTLENILSKFVTKDRIFLNESLNRALSEFCYKILLKGLYQFFLFLENRMEILRWKGKTY